MIDNFEIDGEIIDADGQPVDMSFFISIIQRLAMRVNLDKPEEFDTDVTSISPKTIFHADMGIDRLVRTKIKEKEIHIYLGFLAIFCKLGNVEKILRNILRSAMTIEDIAKVAIAPISSNIKRILDYMNEIHGQKRSIITFQDLEIRVNTYEIMVGYIYGHELSHYLDDVFDFDLRGQHQLEVFKYAIEYLTLFKDTDYKDYAVNILRYIDQDMKMERYVVARFWSEEFLADFQGYQFCLSTLQAAHSTPRRTDMYIAISMVFFATRILEFFKERILNIPISVPETPSSIPP